MCVDVVIFALLLTGCSNLFARERKSSVAEGNATAAIGHCYAGAASRAERYW